LLWWSLSQKHNSLPCFSMGRGILRLFGKIHVNSFSNQIAITVSLCVLGMYTLFYAYEKLHCPFSVSQVICTNELFLLSYLWLVTRVKSRQGDGVKTCQPRHLQPFCPQDNRSKICQLSVLLTWLIAWVLLAQRMTAMWDSCRQTYSFESCTSALPFRFRYFCPRGRDLDFDGKASWMFWNPISFKIQAGVFLGFATFEKYAYRSILMICHRRFAVVKQTMDFIHALFTLTACTVSHLWIRLIPSPTTAQSESK